MKAEIRKSISGTKYIITERQSRTGNRLIYAMQVTKGGHKVRTLARFNCATRQWMRGSVTDIDIVAAVLEHEGGQKYENLT